MNLLFSQLITAELMSDLTSLTPNPGAVAYAQDTNTYYMYVGGSNPWAAIDANRLRYYDNGSPLNGTAKTGDILIWTDSVTTSGGSAAFNLTNDHTSTGTAMFSTVALNSVDANFIDSSGVYQKGSPSLSANKKVLTIPLTKQAFTGVTVLSINVLGSVANNSIPDGVTVKLFVMGVAA